MFAAGLATIGVLLNISAQRKNLREQLEAQQDVAAKQIAANHEGTTRQIEATEARARAERDEQRRIVAYEHYLSQRKLASSLNGELVAIMSLLETRLPKGTFSAYIDQPQLSNAGGQPTLRIESDVATIFRANAGNIGVLPDTVPELLVIFYGEVQSFIERVNKLDRADWSAINVELRQLVVNNMVKDQAHIDDLAMELHKQLSAVNDSIFEWPSSSPKKLSPGQIASLAQILEKADVDPLHLRMWLDSNLTPEEIATRASAHNR